MDRRNIIVIGAAVLLGLFAVIAANAWFSGVEDRQAQAAQEQEMVRVAVAAQDLAFGAPLNADTVRLASWPRQSMPSGAITDMSRIAAGTNVAIRPITRGEPILLSRISDRAILSANIPENMRAVTVPVNAVSGVAGFVFPGDVVDVMLTRQIPGEGASGDDQMTNVLLESVQVLAVDRRAGENDTEPAVGKTATLLVDQYGAQKLTLANKIGELSMALRNVEDQLAGETSTVTLRDLGGSGLYIPGQRGSSVRQASAPARAAAPTPTVAIRAPAPSSGTVTAAPPVYNGPTMTVYRGTDVSTQQVKRHGGY